MLRSISLALMEAENVRTMAQRNGRPALHPKAEYYDDWERERARKSMDGGDRPVEISRNSDEGSC